MATYIFRHLLSNTGLLESLSSPEAGIQRSGCGAAVPLDAARESCSVQDAVSAAAGALTQSAASVLGGYQMR